MEQITIQLADQTFKQVTFSAVDPRFTEIDFEFFQKPFAKNKLSSRWYGDGGVIACLRLFERKLLIRVVGELKVKFAEDESYYKNGQVRFEADERKLDDDGLKRLFDAGFIPDDNWFEVCFAANNNEAGEFDVDGDLLESLQRAVDGLLNDDNWED